MELTKEKSAQQAIGIGIIINAVDMTKQTFDLDYLREFKRQLESGKQTYIGGAAIWGLSDFKEKKMDYEIETIGLLIRLIEIRLNAPAELATARKSDQAGNELAERLFGL